MARDVPIQGGQTIAAQELVTILQAALVDPTTSRTVIHRCTLVDHRQRDGQRGATQYEVEISNPDEDVKSQQLVSALTLGGNRTRRLWDHIEQAGYPDFVPGSGLRPFAYLPGPDILLQVFPFDARFPALHQMVPIVSSQIAEILDADIPRESVRHGFWQGTSVRYRPDMRATVRLEWVPDSPETSTWPRHYFAKLYRDQEQAQHAYDTQVALTEAVAQAGQSLQVARPLPVPLRTNMLLTTAVAGVPLSRTLKRGDDSDAHLQAAGRAVAVLRRLQIAAPARPASSEIAQARDSGERVATTFPELASRANEIVEAIAAGLQGATMCFVNGDLKPEHILIEDPDGGASIIDFDLAATADPMLDVAHFIAFIGQATSRSRARATQGRDPTQTFLDEYFAHASDEGKRRLGLYHAVSAIHKAAGLCRNPGPDAANQAAEILDEGLRFASGEAQGTSAPSFKRRMTRTM